MNLFDLAALNVKEVNLTSHKNRKNDLLDRLLQLYLKGFHSTKDKNYQRAASILSHSLYFPAILSWMRVMGAANVKVVAVEWFSPQDLPWDSKVEAIRKSRKAEYVNSEEQPKFSKKTIDKVFLQTIFTDIYRWELLQGIS